MEMSRRKFIVNSIIATFAANHATAYAANPVINNRTLNGKMTVAFLLYPGITPLDLIGPATVLDNGSFNVEYVWKNMSPVESEIKSVKLYPTCVFDDLKKPDIICVPGTGNPFNIICDVSVLQWLYTAGRHARYVTSVCTGSIILAAAGLMDGYRAATHWSMEGQLKEMGALPVKDRVVIDRNRITGGGVTAGIDFGLTLLALLKSEEEAKLSQLLMQYDPHPPYRAGTPETAGPDITRKATKLIFDNIKKNKPNYQKCLNSL